MINFYKNIYKVDWDSSEKITNEACFSGVSVFFTGWRFLESGAVALYMDGNNVGKIKKELADDFIRVFDNY